MWWFNRLIGVGVKVHLADDIGKFVLKVLCVLRFWSFVCETADKQDPGFLKNWILFGKVIAKIYLTILSFWSCIIAAIGKLILDFLCS